MVRFFFSFLSETSRFEKDTRV